jgi:hypothetical protein
VFGGRPFNFDLDLDDHPLVLDLDDPSFKSFLRLLKPSGELFSKLKQHEMEIKMKNEQSPRKYRRFTHKNRKNNVRFLEHCVKKYV